MLWRKRALDLGALVSLALACCAPTASRTAAASHPTGATTRAALASPSSSSTKAATETDLELHWAGVTVHDFQAAYDFYAALFDLPRYRVNDWVMLRERDGMTLELFQGTVAPDPRRAWGAGQAVRLGLMTTDLERSVALLRANGAAVGVVGESQWGAQVEIAATEGIRWSLVQADENGPRTPYVGLAEIKAADVTAQRAFYAGVMGVPVTHESPERTVMSQHAAGPYLALVPGGSRAAPSRDFDPKVVNEAVFLSFKTHDIEAAARYLGAAGATQLSRPAHYSWGGTMFFVADADANPIQIVEYD